MRSDARPSAPTAAVAPPLHFIGALLVVLPLVDLALNVWPLQPGDFRWRFGVVGLLASYLLTPLLGAALLAGAAVLSPSPVTRRAVGWLNVAGGVLLLVALALFLLDLTQLRPVMTPEALPSFDVSNARALLKLTLGAAALLWLGVAGLRRPRAAAVEERAPERAAPPPRGRTGPLVPDAAR